MHQRKTLKKNAHVQLGVYAVEWAIVFPVFFILVYAIISYGLMFLVRESMQNAVEDGARAALRYQPSREERLDLVQQVVHERLSWLPISLRHHLDPVRVEVCPLSVEQDCVGEPVCSVDINTRCLVRVSLELNYEKAPLTPPLPSLLPGVRLLIPEKLAASASVMADKGGV